MSKRNNLILAKRHLSPKEFLEYKDWLEKPWSEKYPYLANLLLILSVILNIVLTAVVANAKQ